MSDIKNLPDSINEGQPQLNIQGLKDEDGVYITSVEQTTSSASDDGINTITVTLFRQHTQHKADKTVSVQVIGAIMRRMVKQF